MKRRTWIGIGVLLAIGYVGSRASLPTNAGPTPAAAPLTDLVGRVQFTGTQFVVYSDDPRPWRECWIEINGRYRREFAALDSGAAERFGTGLALANDGERFDPARYAPTAFTLRCRVDGRPTFLNGSWR